MKRYLLDTGIAACYIDHRHGVHERARLESAQSHRISISHPILAELVYRVEGGPNRERNLQRLQLALTVWKIWPITEDAAFEYGRIAAELRRIGRMIGQNDLWIAAAARARGNCTVVTMDADFSVVPALTIENWANSPP